MADFRLRIGFAKEAAAVWLSHLELVRAMERCVRRSGLPAAISQGFSPHLKHSFTAALPVGTGSQGEFMDLELTRLVAEDDALAALQAVQHEFLPIISVAYVPKDEPSLQVYFNRATYLVEFAAPNATLVSELLASIAATKEITLTKKGRHKSYELALYLVSAEACGSEALTLTLDAHPQGALRPEVLLKALEAPNLDFALRTLTRTMLAHAPAPTPAEG